MRDGGLAYQWAWIAALLFAVPSVRAESDSGPLDEVVRPGTINQNAPSPEPTLFQTPVDSPLGFTGPSGILPREYQQNDHFVPVEDRWRLGFPAWDRYGKGHPSVDDYPFVEGHWWDPFNQNVLKGDYPLIGQNIFLALTASTRAVVEPREVPTATTPFESTLRPHSEQFFGRPNQLGYSQFFTLSL